jgi:sarcosine oxidase subunit gamma
MTRTFVAKGMEIVQQDLQQILLRGKGDGSFAETVNKEVSLLPPSDNLRMINNDEFLFAKQSFDQWSLVCLKPKPEKEMFRLVSAFNVNEEILASDYSNTTYFEITGENKNHYLSKLTHFDLRPKNFPVSTIAQTLIARIDCSIYHLQDKYLVTCHSSFEDYFKDRLQDTIDL